MKSKLYNFVMGILIITFVLLNVLAIFWFNGMVFNEFETSAKLDLQDIADDEKRSITLLVQGKEDILIALAELIGQTGNSPEQLYVHMDRWSKNYDIETILITSTDGKGISSCGAIADVSYRPNINEALNDGVYVSGVLKSEFSNKEVIAVSTPIYYESTIQGILTAEFSIEYLTSLLMDSTDTRGSSMIVNSSGHILMHTYPFDISFDNFKSATFEEGKSHAKILNDFANGKEGSVEFSIGGVRKLGEYTPIGINDWTLFFEISEDMLQESANSITRAMLIISICLAFSFVFFMVYILTMRKKSIKEIEKVAYYDKLTGIPNLIKFKIDVENVVNKKDMDVTNYALIKCDLENFKAINEVYGFAVGNKVICTIANYVKEIIGDPVIVARTGTDEFIIFAQKDVIDRHLSVRFALSNLIKDFVPEVEGHQFFFRYGRYSIEEGEKNIDEIVNKVGMAHSFARVEGGAVVWDYDNTFKKHLLHLTEITNKMRFALENNEFKLFLQPKISLQKSTLVGAEALVRWIEPNGNMIFPNDFIPIFEKNEFIIDLDKYMFEQTCILLQKWMQTNKECIPISVNFSRVHFKHSGFAYDLCKIAENYNVPTKYLEIELTETTIMENQKELISILATLREAGFAISIDDFGSGYSSLGMLKDYKVDVIKLDRSFFTSTVKEKSSDVVIEGIVDIIHNLGAKVVAEGIETEEQINFLKKTECYAAQGYFYAKPMSIADFEKQNGYTD